MHVNPLETLSAELASRLADLRADGVDVEARARLMMDRVAAAIPADRSSLYLLDHATMSLRSMVASGMGKQIVVPLRMGVIGTAILQRQVMNVPDAQSHPFFNPDVDTSLGFHTRSLLVAPMINAQGIALGGLELVNKRVGSFTAEDTVGAEKAAARLTRWCVEDTIYPAGVEAECVAMRNEIGCERASVFQLDERNSRLTALYADGDDGRVLTLNMRLGIAGMVAISGSPVLLDEAWDDPRFDRTFDTRTGYRTHTMLCVPIRPSGGASLGVVQLINATEGRFEPRHTVALEAAARVFAEHLAESASGTG